MLHGFRLSDFGYLAWGNLCLVIEGDVPYHFYVCAYSTFPLRVEPNSAAEISPAIGDQRLERLFEAAVSDRDEGPYRLNLGKWKSAKKAPRRNARSTRRAQPLSSWSILSA